MGIISEKKKHEMNRLKNNEFSMRIGAIALVDVSLAIIIDSISVFYKNDLIGLIFGFLSLVVALYCINGKWFSWFKNKRLLREIIDFGTSISVFIFAIEKVGIPFLNNINDKIMICIIFGLFGIAIIMIVIIMIKKIDWKYNED